MKPPSRLAVRLVKRLKEEHKLALTLEPENYRIYCDRTAAAINRWGEDHWTWSLGSSNVYGRWLPVMATMDGREVEIEIGSHIPVSVLLRIKEWALERQQFQFTILASTKGIWPR